MNWCNSNLFYFNKIDVFDFKINTNWNKEIEIKNFLSLWKKYCMLLYSVIQFDRIYIYISAEFLYRELENFFFMKDNTCG